MAGFDHPEYRPTVPFARRGEAVSFFARGADTDPLTGLATRRRLLEHLGELVGDAFYKRHQPGLILLDLERFKTMNDGLGPLICDKLYASNSTTAVNSGEGRGGPE